MDLFYGFGKVGGNFKLLGVILVVFKIFLYGIKCYCVEVWLIFYLCVGLFCCSDVFM